MNNRKHLYHARINARLTLEQIGMRTALSPTVLRNIDEGRFELLPSGLYARSYVRTFAVAVGLDPDEALAEVEPLLPGVPDPVPALNAARGFTGAEQVWRWLADLRLRTQAINRIERWRVLAGREHIARYAAAAIDAAVLLVVDALLLLLVSWSSRIPAGALLGDASVAIAALSAIPIVLYFLLFGGIAGTTVGRWFLKVVPPAPDHPLTLPDILRRAAFH